MILVTAVVFVDDVQATAEMKELQRFCDEKAEQHEKCREMYREKAKAAFTADDVVILVTHSASLLCLFHIACCSSAYVTPWRQN